MKLLRLLSRIVLLSLAAAAFVGLTKAYGSSVQLPVPSPRAQAERLHRLSAPEVGQLPEFLGQAVLLAFFAVVGRVFFRLRLSLVLCSEGPPILLDLAAKPAGLPTKKSGS